MNSNSGIRMRRLQPLFDYKELMMRISDPIKWLIQWRRSLEAESQIVYKVGKRTYKAMDETTTIVGLTADEGQIVKEMSKR